MNKVREWIGQYIYWVGYLICELALRVGKRSSMQKFMDWYNARIFRESAQNLIEAVKFYGTSQNWDAEILKDHGNKAREAWDDFESRWPKRK